jgi:hypothetical protein
MKNLLFTFFALFFLNQAFAQYALEHTYSIHGELYRARIPGFGEKYYFVDNEAHTIVFFNADHTSWKTITPQNLPAIVDRLDVYLVFGANVVKNDGLFYLLIHVNGTDLNGAQNNYDAIINENGETIFNKAGILITLPNWQQEYVVENLVYALPGLTLSHTYSSYLWQYILASPGALEPAYFADIDYDTEQIFLNTAYNQLIRTIPFPPITPGYNRSSQLKLTDDIGDGTTDMKILFTENDPVNNTINFKVFRENGEQLFTKQFALDAGYYGADWQNSFAFGPSKNKLLISNAEAGIQYHHFYSLPEFTLEKDLLNSIPYEIEPGSIRWAAYQRDETQTDITLYNPDDWSATQTFTKPLGITWYFGDFSKYVFDSDPGLESLNVELINGQTKPVIRELSDQSIIFQDDTLVAGRVSRIPGTINKLICFTNGVNGNPNIFKVYSLRTVTTLNINDAAARQLDVSISPNPSSSGNVFVSFEQMPESSVDVTVFNAQGILTGQVQSTGNEQIAVPETCFPTQGLYFVTVRAGDWKGVAKVMRQ